MVFYQFQQAENEEYQSMKKWNSAVEIVAAETNGTVMNSETKIRYGGIFTIIAKISIFVMPVFFAMIAKITVHSEIFCFFFLSKQLRFWFSHFYPHCNYSSLVILVFHMFVRLYKPL